MKSITKLAIAAFAVPATGIAANASPTFDGEWSVEVQAHAGQCDQSYRVPINVTDGQISYSGRFSVQASGAVNSAGTLDVQLAHGRDVVNATGQLGSQWGQGQWSSATLDCSGTWLARRS